jgi:hypothetical protein
MFLPGNVCTTRDLTEMWPGMYCTVCVSCLLDGKGWDRRWETRWRHSDMDINMDMDGHGHGYTWLIRLASLSWVCSNDSGMGMVLG